MNNRNANNAPPLHPKQLQIAFLGGGINSAVGKAHRTAVELDQRYQLVAGCFSLNSEINTASALEYRVQKNRTYTNLATLLEAEAGKIDVIAILTPTPHHKQDVIQCLKKGVPVICEKSLAASSAEVMEIKNALESNKGFLAVTYNYTGYPMLRELRQMIKRGLLGKVEQIHIEMPQEGFVRRNEQDQPNTPQEWRLHDGLLPTLSLDLGTHLHHMIHFLTEEKPIELVAVQNQFGAFDQVVDNAICIANYTNSIVCNIWFSKTALGHRNGFRVRVYGDKGATEWYQMDPELIHYSDYRGHRSIIDRANLEAQLSAQDRYNRFKAGHPAGFIEAFANLYSDIADNLLAFQETKQPVVDEFVAGINEAMEGMLMLEAIATSAKQKTWVKLS